MGSKYLLPPNINIFIYIKKKQLKIVAKSNRKDILMSKKEKLIKKFLKLGNDFESSEIVSLLNQLGFYETQLGKTTGSAVCFSSKDNAVKIRFHKLHPDKYMKKYVMKQIKEMLEKKGLL